MKNIRGGYGDILKTSKAGMTIGNSINLFLIPIMLLFGDYFRTIASIDKAVLYFTIIGAIVYTLMRLGVIKGYYRHSYKKMSDALLLFSVLFWNAFPRVVIYYASQVFFLKRATTNHQIITLTNKLKSIIVFDKVTLVTLFILIGFFISLFLIEKHVLISDYHGKGKRNPIAVNKKTSLSNYMVPVNNKSRSNETRESGNNNVVDLCESEVEAEFNDEPLLRRTSR